QTLHEYGIHAGRRPGLTGAWVAPHTPGQARTTCALGGTTGRGVTMHGFALNANPDVRYFDRIIPRGISETAVTSMSKELGHPQDMNEVQQVLKDKLAQQFGFEWV